MLIAYSYSKLGINEKADAIYKDVEEQAEKSAMFNILMIAKYLIAELKLIQKKEEEALIIVNDALAMIQKYANSAKILYVLYEKLYLKIVNIIV